MTRNQVIIPSSIVPYPYDFEVSAALILSVYYSCDVEFIARSSTTTPDIVIGNIRWEIKSPVGKGKRNIQHQFNRGMKQSKNIVFDARRSKMDVRKIRRELMRQSTLMKSLKRLILINKNSEVEVIK